MRIFIAGEGPSELGDWARHPSFRDDPPRPGVIVALLGRIRGDGWEIGGSRQWKEIRKYRVLPHGSPEIRNVLGAALHAKEAGCDILAFVRDRDGDRDREGQVTAGVARVAEILRPPLPLAGGVAVETIESWLLSLAGRTGAESLRHPKEQFGQHSVEKMVTVVVSADLDAIPTDAVSLLRWLAQADRALNRPPPSS
jgi:hypothetical protein